MLLLVNLSFAQNTTPYTYNPDSNGDWMIGSVDLVDFLPLFGNPFTPQLDSEETTLVLVPCQDYWMDEESGCQECYECDAPLCPMQGNFPFGENCLQSVYQLGNLLTPPPAMMMKPDSNGFWHIPYGWDNILLVDMNPGPFYVWDPDINFLLEEYPGYNYWELDQATNEDNPCWTSPIPDPQGIGGTPYSIYGDLAPSPLGFPNQSTKIHLLFRHAHYGWNFIEVYPDPCNEQVLNEQYGWGEIFEWNPLHYTIVVNQNGAKEWRKVISY